MNKPKLIPITTLVALAATMIAAPGASADVTSCATTGTAGPIVPGVQAIVPDLAVNAGDSLTGVDPLTDTDNGVRNPNAGWEDGNYVFNSDAGVCMAVDTDGPGDDGFRDTGLYSAIIDSQGAYDNTVCGTGLAADRGPADGTAINLTPIAALGPGEDIVEANYLAQFVAGAGPITISHTRNVNGEVATGTGTGEITPTVGNCVTTDVTQFELAAEFRVAGVGPLGE